MRQRITIKVIAEKAGVNPATVSRALNPATASLISEKVREKIRRICNELDYRPSYSGRSIVTGKTFKIGMILGRMQMDFAAHDWARIISNLTSELQKHNYSLLMLHADGSESMDSQVKNFLMSGVADGYVTGQSMLGTEVAELLKKLDVPLWAVCNPHNKTETANFILRDDSQTLADIWQKIPAEFHNSTAFFAHSNNENKLRQQDIQDVATQLFGTENIKVASLYYRRPSHFSAMEYRDAAKNSAAMLNEIKKYKVIWCESDFVAQALYDVLEMNDIRVGRDIHIIGYGNLETYAESSEPPFLSTISANVEKIASELCKVILADINGKKIKADKIYSTFIPGKTFNF